ncbi:MAG: type 4a pilus biogenesis protein PilO [Polyangiaceae bacterium]|jgi:type IV pilus assembly protein PilO
MATPATSLNLAKIGVPARIGIGLGVTVVTALTYWVIFYGAVAQKIQQTRGQGIALSAELAAQKLAQASYFADRDELARLQQGQRELNKVLPETTEQASFLSAIQSVSNVSGIDLKAWQPLEERQEAFFAKVPMRLEMTGRFHQVAKFAYEIGKLDRIINVENIQLSNPQKSGEDVILSARCLATTFHMIEKAGDKK